MNVGGYRGLCCSPEGDCSGIKLVGLINPAPVEIDFGEPVDIDVEISDGIAPQPVLYIRRSLGKATYVVEEKAASELSFQSWIVTEMIVWVGGLSCLCGG